MMTKRLLHWPFGWRADLELLFEPRDCWIGIFWDENGRAVQFAAPGERFGHIYVVLIPMLPLHFCWYRGRYGPQGAA